MITEARFPATLRPPHYHPLHVMYVANIFTAAGVRATFSGHDGDDTTGHCLYTVDLGGRRAIIDYCDFRLINTARAPGPIFKYGFPAELIGQKTHLYPFPGAGVYDWPAYRAAQAAAAYPAAGWVIAGHGRGCSPEAWARREDVMARVAREFGPAAYVERAGGEPTFWCLVNHAAAAILVPGSADNMPTRAYHQLFGLGCCVISTELLSVLPHYRRWESGVHYLPCRPDYSDAPAQARWCMANPRAARAIGHAAACLFAEECSPPAVLAWVEQCMEDYYRG